VITPRPGRAAALAAWAALREWRVTTAVEAASPLGGDSTGRPTLRGRNGRRRVDVRPGLVNSSVI